MSTQPTHFAPLARLLHWLMALMIIAMLLSARAWSPRCLSVMNG
jgi:cytochrome b561